MGTLQNGVTENWQWLGEKVHRRISNIIEQATYVFYSW